MIDIKEYIKEQIKGDCTFDSYRAGNLWYVTAYGFKFPVPISDTGEATFDAKIKGIHLMRYIRKHIDLLSSNGKTTDSESENRSSNL